MSAGAQTPPVPSQVSASKGTYAGGVRVWWTAVSGATAYDIWRSAIPSKTTAQYLASVGGSKTEYIDTTIPANTSYYYWVRTVVKGVASDFGYYHEGYWLPGPAAPTNVQASDGIYVNRILLTWNAVAGATSYQVWRSLTDAWTTSVHQATTTATSFFDDWIDPRLTYYYWLKASNSEGTSAFSWSNPGYAKAALPGAATNVRASDGQSLAHVLVTWDHVPSATLYEIWRSSGTELWTATRIATVDPLTGNPERRTAYEDPTVEPLRLYTYWVRAINPLGYGQFSAGDSGFRELSLPGKPMSLTASEGMYAGRVRITWQAAARATQYEILRNVVRDLPSAPVVARVAAVPDLNEYWDAGGVGGTVYFYWVRGVNGAGVGEASWSAKGYWNPGPSAPTNVKATDGTRADGVLVTWIASSGAFLYEVWRNTIRDPSSAVMIGATMQTSYLDASATPGQMYFYWVKAANVAGTSGFSWTDSGYLEGPTPVVRSLAVPMAQAEEGVIVVVPVMMEAKGDENAVAFSLRFDPALLTFQGLVAGGGLPPGAMFIQQTQNAAAGQVGVALALQPGGTLGPGPVEVARLEVSVRSGAAPRLAVVEFFDQPTARQIVDFTARPLLADWMAGGIQVVKASAPGYEADVSPLPDGDGAVTLADWVQVGRFIAGLDPGPRGTIFRRADCAPRSTRGNGSLDIQDWVQAGRYVQGLDPLTETGGPDAPILAAGASSMTTTLATGLAGGSMVGAATVLLAPLPAPGSAPAVSVEVGSVSLAETPWTPVLMTSSGGVNALSFTISFDRAGLEYQGAEPGPELHQAGALLLVNDRDAAGGVLGIAVAMPPGRFLPAGLVRLASLRFAAIHPEQPARFEVRLTDERMVRSVSDTEARPLTADFRSGVLMNGPPPQVGDPSVPVEPKALKLRDAEEVVLTWSSRAGRSYRIEKSIDLINWHPLDRVTGQEGTTTLARRFPGEPRVFLRVVEESD